MYRIFELIEHTKIIQTEEEFLDVIQRLLSFIEFDYFLFGLSLPKSITEHNTIILDNYPEDWRSYYEEEGLVSFDPTVSYCKENSSPLEWSEINNHSLSKESAVVMLDANSAGLKYGFSIPLHSPLGGFGMLSLATTDSKYSPSKQQHALLMAQTFAPVLQDAYRRIGINNQTHTYQSLTKRETETLTWASAGKSAWEISMILGCSERTVNFHLTNAMIKLDVRNRYQAISKGILIGAISPQLIA